MKINARCWRLDLWSGSTDRRREKKKPRADFRESPRKS